MNEKLKDAWNKAVQTGEKVDVGDIVVCDICDVDYTGSPESGGFVFGSTGYCPVCAVEGLETIKKYNEEKYIKATCPPDKSYADFIREYRGPNNYIQISKL